MPLPTTPVFKGIRYNNGSFGWVWYLCSLDLYELRERLAMENKSDVKFVNMPASTPSETDHHRGGYICICL